MDDQFIIKGADKLVRDLRQFTPRLQKSAINKAARKAMTIVRDDARARAKQFDDPATDNPIWKRIAISPKKGRVKGNYVMRVGVQGGARSSKSRENPFWWRFIELGTETQRARPFLVPALQSNAGAVIDKFTSELSTEIDKLAAKVRAGG